MSKGKLCFSNNNVILFASLYNFSFFFIILYFNIFTFEFFMNGRVYLGAGGYAPVIS